MKKMMEQNNQLQKAKSKRRKSYSPEAKKEAVSRISAALQHQKLSSQEQMLFPGSPTDSELIGSAPLAMLKLVSADALHQGSPLKNIQTVDEEVLMLEGNHLGKWAPPPIPQVRPIFKRKTVSMLKAGALYGFKRGVNVEAITIDAADNILSTNKAYWEYKSDILAQDKDTMKLVTQSESCVIERRSGCSLHLGVRSSSYSD